MNELQQLTSNQPMSQEDIMINILQTQKEEKERVNMLESRVNNIEDTAPIHPALNNRLTKQRKAKVMEWLGGRNSKAYKHIEFREDGTKHKFSQSVFKEMELDYKAAFDINSYAELPKGKLAEAREYIESWEPCTNTKRKINQLNNQVELALVK